MRLDRLLRDRGLIALYTAGDLATSAFPSFPLHVPFTQGLVPLSTRLNVIVGRLTHTRISRSMAEPERAHKQSEPRTFRTAARAEA